MLPGSNLWFGFSYRWLNMTIAAVKSAFTLPSYSFINYTFTNTDCWPLALRTYKAHQKHRLLYRGKMNPLHYDS